MQNSLVPKEDTTLNLFCHKRTLDQRIDSIKINSATAEAEAKKAGEKLLRDKLAGLFKITDVINTFLKWGEETDKAIRGIKREKLFEQYLDLSDQNEAAISQLKEFLTNPSGNALFNKIIGIADDSPPDIELLQHLSAAMYHIVNSDFEALFAEHRHALAQIERLTPQALSILSDCASWPQFQLGTVSTVDGVVTSEWVEEFSEFYANNKGVRDHSVRLRIAHSVRELQNIRLIVAVQKEVNGPFTCLLTGIGNEIRKYIQR